MPRPPRRFVPEVAGLPPRVTPSDIGSGTLTIIPGPFDWTGDGPTYWSGPTAPYGTPIPAPTTELQSPILVGGGLAP